MFDSEKKGFGLSVNTLIYPCLSICFWFICWYFDLTTPSLSLMICKYHLCVAYLLCLLLQKLRSVFDKEEELTDALLSKLKSIDTSVNKWEVNISVELSNCCCWAPWNEQSPYLFENDFCGESAWYCIISDLRNQVVLACLQIVWILHGRCVKKEWKLIVE